MLTAWLLHNARNSASVARSSAYLALLSGPGGGECSAAPFARPRAAHSSALVAHLGATARSSTAAPQHQQRHQRRAWHSGVPHSSARAAWRSSGTAALAAAGAATAAAAAAWTLAAPPPASAAAPAPAPAPAAGPLTSDGVEASNFKLLSLDTRRRIFFKYEKRIREMSTLEKTYEYFATNTAPSGAKTMDVRDAVRAVVPTYPASDSTAERAGFLDGERGRRVAGGMAAEPRASAFRALDDDGDGCVSFPEFRLIVLLLSIPAADIEVVFSVLDQDGSGTVTAPEFELMLAQLEKGAGLPNRHHGRAGKHDSISTADAERKEPGNLAKALFGSRLTGRMDLKRFRAFLDQLHSDVTRLEYAHYDANGDGAIKGVDFARSIAAAADVQSVDAYLDRADAMPPALRGAPISFADFQSLAYLRRHLHRLSYALEFCSRVGRPIHRADLAALTQRLVGVRLSPVVLDVLFALFGDAEGRLEGAELIRLLRHRERVPGRKAAYMPGAQPNAGPLLSLWRCVKGCIVDPDEMAMEAPDA